MRYRSFLLAVASCAPAASPAQAASHFEDGIAVVNDRVFRGLSQTRGNPAVIGEVKWKDDDGLFVGLWASNFAYDAGERSIELVPFVGKTLKLGGGAVEVGLLYHYRPVRGRDLDYAELSIAFDRKFGKTGMRLGTFLSPDGMIGSRSAYSYLDLRHPLGMIGRFRIAGTAHVGRFDFARRGNGYEDWRLGLSASVPGLILGAGLSVAHPPSGSQIPGAREGGTRVSLSATKMF